MPTISYIGESLDFKGFVLVKPREHALTKTGPHQKAQRCHTRDFHTRPRQHLGTYSYTLKILIPLPIKRSLWAHLALLINSIGTAVLGIHSVFIDWRLKYVEPCPKTTITLLPSCLKLCLSNAISHRQYSYQSANSASLRRCFPFRLSFSLVFLT